MLARIQPRRLLIVLIAPAIMSLSACQQRMAHQPGNRTLSESEFFPDRRSARPLEQGVVHRFQSLDNDPLVTGLTAKGRKAQPVSIGPKPEDKLTTGPGVANDLENFVATLPFALGKEDLKRGQERYGIYCALCHGIAGDGKGKIVERGFLAPTNYHAENSRGFAFFGLKVPMRDVPVGYIYEVIAKGYGGMPDHASQIPPADRWRIAAYVKALQLAHQPDKLKPEHRAEMEKQLGGGK